jgi:hypothetical protein
MVAIGPALVRIVGCCWFTKVAAVVAAVHTIH